MAFGCFLMMMGSTVKLKNWPPQAGRGDRSLGGLALLGAMVGLGLGAVPMVAQAELPSPESLESLESLPSPAAAPNQPKQPANQLEPDPTDELLPEGASRGKLSPAEQQQLRLSAAQLDQEANAAYDTGDRPRAYRLWFRALRLLQYGDADEEIVALGRIGAKAWRDGLPTESQAIAQRLLKLDQDLGQTLEQQREQRKNQNHNQIPSREALLATQAKLALAHEQVGALDPAIAQYEELLAQNPLPDNRPALPEQRQLIAKLAQLNAARLNYPAAIRYTELQLEQLRRQPPSTPGPTLPSLDADVSAVSPASNPPQAEPTETQLTETQLIARLAYFHEQTQDWQAAIAQQQILLSRLDPTQLRQRPALRLAIATNQDKAGLASEASQTYQDAYRDAQTQQQFGISHEALAKLARLYEARSQFDDALTVYNVLRLVDELSYNLFGLLQTHEQMARLYQRQGQDNAARQALRQALHLAQQLDHRADEIAAQLSALDNILDPEPQAAP